MDLRKGIDAFKEIIGKTEIDRYLIIYVDLDNIDTSYSIKDINMEIDENKGRVRIFDSSGSESNIKTDTINNWEINKDSSELYDEISLTLHMPKRCFRISAQKRKY